MVGVKAFRGVGAGVGTGFLTVGTGFFTVTLGAGFLTVGTGFLTVALGTGFLTLGLGAGFLTVGLGLAAHRWCNVQIVRQGWPVSGCPPLLPAIHNTAIDVLLGLYGSGSGADAAGRGVTHVLALSAPAWWVLARGRRACICNERTIEHAAACLDDTAEWESESEAV